MWKTETLTQCSRCKARESITIIREDYGGKGFPDIGLKNLGKTSFEYCPKCGICYEVHISPGFYSDDDKYLTKIDPVQSEIIRILVIGEKNKKRLEFLFEKAKNLYYIRSYNGLDLRPIIQILIKKSPSRKILGVWLELIESAALQGEDILKLLPYLQEYLSHSNNDFVISTIHTFGYAAKHNVDISEYIPKIVKLLQNKNSVVVMTVSDTLTNYVGSNTVRATTISQYLEQLMIDRDNTNIKKLLSFLNTFSPKDRTLKD